MSREGLTIREVVARTGVEAPTLRMWEQRHGFPEPTRLPSGHRRYSARDVELIAQALRDRESGLELRAALEKAKRAAAAPAPAPAEGSIHAALRRRRPTLEPYLLPKRTLMSVSHAIEDECGSRGERALLLGSFQSERFYRGAEARWRDLAGPARYALVMADFGGVGTPPGGPVEVPIARGDPIGREWSLICEAPTFSACLSGWERPGQEEVEDQQRQFEMFWSVDPEVVSDAARLACEIVERAAPEVADGLRAAVETGGGRGSSLSALTSLTNRMVAYVGGGRATRLPEPRPPAAA